MSHSHPAPSPEGRVPKEWVPMQSRGATASLLPPHPGRVPWCPECLNSQDHQCHQAPCAAGGEKESNGPMESPHGAGGGMCACGPAGILVSWEGKC